MEIIRKTTTYNGTELLKAPFFPYFKRNIQRAFEQILVLEFNTSYVRNSYSKLVYYIFNTLAKEKSISFLSLKEDSLDIIIPSKDYFYTTLLPSLKEALNFLYLKKKKENIRKNDFYLDFYLKDRNHSYITKEQIFVD